MMGNTEIISASHGCNTIFLLWFEYLLTFHFILICNLATVPVTVPLLRDIVAAASSPVARSRLFWGYLS